ncbi:hypothetical protein J4Q44_G00037540 [Coregonus suidteri]|uniref:Rab-GAP TBC domain-containing protein n=1 Tax=Coregonus suidteri TaxID=861788 RepID=A0AAN8REF2_9TELE
MADGMKARLQRFNLFNVKTEPKPVPEIISTLRQAGKSSARNDDLTAPKPAASSSEDCTTSSSANSSSVSTTTASTNAICAATMFAKRFEVLFCGRVTVAHKKAPPALIDECIEKFSQSIGAGGGPKPESGGGLMGGLRRALTLPTLTHNVRTGDGGCSGRPVVFKRDPSFPCLQALDENGLSPELHTQHQAGVQPTSLQENRTMLFMVGQSQIFLVSPDTKKVAIEKSFREISFCSQCTDEALVDEIMLTLKQAFSVAALQQSVRTKSQQCDSCPMQQLHRLCERIEGLHPSKAKLEFQKHLATLDNQEQAAVFENIVRASPKSDQEENELVMGSLRSLYEERQKTHQHPDYRPVPEAPSPAPVEVQSSSRQRLEQFKTRAKRSLTESLEGIWKGSSKAQGSEREQSHNSTGDLKRLDTSPLSLSPSFSSLSLSPRDTQQSQPHDFRRRASTFSHPPTPSYTHTPQVPSGSTKPKLVRHYSVSTDTPHQSKRLQEEPTLPLPSFPSPLLSPRPSSPSLGGRLAKRNPLGVLRTRLVSSSSVPNFLKLLAPVHENHPCDLDKRSDVAALSGPIAACVVGDSPLRRHSWRQQIFLRVATPQKNTDSHDRGDCSLEGRGVSLGGVGDGTLGVVREERKRRGQAELRELWRKAILQHIILLRMERENNKIQASESKRLRLDYEEITPCLKDVTLVWESMLGTQARSKVKFNTDTVHAAVGQGVPRQYRGEVWKFLSEQYLLRQMVPLRPPAIDTPYKDLLKQLTSQQHAILIDLGRTFPTHPYFQAQLGAGQLSLYNLLKAYSLLDPEVGYCQGLSFVAGVLLLHMGEEDAFNMLKFLMYHMGLRKQYRPDMIILQVCEMDLSKQLQAYEVEYHVLQDELCDTPAHLNESQRTAQLERTNQNLRQQSLDLLEELQTSQARVCRLEGRVEGLVQSEALLREQVFDLEEERSRLRSTVTHLHTLLTALGIRTHTAHGDFNLALHTHSAADRDRDGQRGGEGVDVPTGEGPRQGNSPQGEGPRLGQGTAVPSPLLPHPLALPEH